jgi:restriction system protein
MRRAPGKRAAKMKSYYKVMLGKKSNLAEQCFKEGFIGADYGMSEDLTHKLTEEWRVFNREFIPIYLAKYPGNGVKSACVTV